MRSIGARIAVWYACAATATLAALFIAGYQFLQAHLIHGLDLLNEAEFHQIEAHLGPDYATLSAPFIEMRIRDIADFAYALFYVEMHVPKKGTVFRSSNLNGRDIPDVHGHRQYSVDIAEIGEVRAAEFQKPPFEVTIATPLRPVREVMASYVQVAVGLLAAMLVGSLVIGFGFSRVVLRPVRAIRDTANRIRSDNLSERIPVAEVGDEISDLARLLNQMFDRLEKSFGQIRRFTADASHELKTPLSLIRLHSEKLLLDDTLSTDHRDAVQVQLEEVARLNRIIEDLLLLSRADANAIELKLSEQEVTGFLQGFTQDALVLVEHHGLAFVHEHRGEGRVAFEQKWLRQVLLNLLTNAIHVSPSGGRITLLSVLKDGHWRLSVEDQGPGLQPEQRERMFERFVRVVTPGVEYPGSGLGLAICRSIVELHGGRIFAVAGTGDAGLRVVVELPASPA
jgi:two-component system heavy metal sensor histidine kinase CusS